MLLNLREKLRKTREKLTSALHQILLSEKTLTVEDINRLEEVLITADVGVETTREIIDELNKRTREGILKGNDAREILAQHLLEILGCPKPLEIITKPFVIIVMGINGTGKTTTIGKLANRMRLDGKKVLIAGADTFRAAADHQLEIWARRANVDMLLGQMGADPASIVFDAIQKAKARDFDVVIADTAGRLHTKKNLMDELAKICRAAGKAFPSAPHETLLVIDATTGQNGLAQAEVFHKSVNLTGIVLTKLDSTAKGGIAVAIVKKLGIPVRMIGVGEKIEDLVDFDPAKYVETIIGASGNETG